MANFLSILKKYSSKITTYSLYAAAGFALLAHCGNFTNAFMPVVGNLFLLLFDVTFLALIPLCMTLKKNEWAKIVFIPVFSYWTISTVYDFLSDTFMARKIFGGLTVAVSVFEFFIAIAVLAGIVLFVVNKIKKNALFDKIIPYIFVGAIALFFITFILNIANDATGDANWNAYFYNFRTFLALPVGMFFSWLTFCKKEDLPVETVVDPFDETAAEEPDPEENTDVKIEEKEEGKPDDTVDGADIEKEEKPEENTEDGTDVQPETTVDSIEEDMIAEAEGTIAEQAIEMPIEE